MANVVTASKVILFLSLLTFSAWITSGIAQPLYPDTILFHGKISRVPRSLRMWRRWRFAAIGS
jgi:hypothetical protein